MKGWMIMLSPLLLAVIHHIFNVIERRREERAEQKALERRRNKGDHQVTYEHEWPDDDRDSPT